MAQPITLNDQEHRWLSGADGEAMKLAMTMMVMAADVAGATAFIPVEFAHIDSSFYTGQASVDFAEYMLAHGATLAVPTHTNASLIDCASPELGDDQLHRAEVKGAMRLMEIYTELGCSAMFSCAPYAEPVGRPRMGAQIVGSESNAVSFFNSVLGARTNKYGDFIDVCAAMTGRVPLAGLHTDQGRLGTHVFDVSQLSSDDLNNPTLPHVLGIIMGQAAGSAIPVVVGLDTASEDELKAIAAAGSSSGAVEMFHIVGVTPEAATLDVATGGRAPLQTTEVTPTLIAQTRARLSTGQTESLRAVCLGTPHFSVSEFADLRSALNGRRVNPDVNLMVTTSRTVCTELGLRGWDAELEDAGVQIIRDRCTYYTPKTAGIEGLVMTNSAKWAYYAPGVLKIQVAFGSLEACVDAAVTGHAPKMSARK